VRSSGGSAPLLLAGLPIPWVAVFASVGYQIRMLRKMAAIFAWSLLAFIVFATISPLQERPRLPTSVGLERIAAFVMLGGLFCSAYPKRIVFVCFIVLGSALLLEYLQMLTPDRHARLIDASEKIAGGAVGIFATRVASYFWRLTRISQNQN
jgi:hypothetical protein